MVHIRFGEGVVQSLAGDALTVRFGAEEKSLTYPTVFETGVLRRAGPAPVPRTKTGLEWAVPGAAVSHRSFGDGVIESISGDQMTVRFSDSVKQFLYPGAFDDGYLTARQ